MSASILTRHREPDAIENAWAGLRDHLARRVRELNDEVRCYPTPIAHCDDQLTKLLEDRGRAVRRWKLAEAACGETNAPATDRLQRLARLIVALESSDDDVEQALRKRLADVLSAAPR